MSETKFGWKKLKEFNKKIGESIGHKPKISYSIGNDNSSVISFDDKPEAFAKHKADIWYRDNKHRESIKDLSVKKREHYPQYHRDWNELMNVILILNKTGTGIIISPEIEVTYERVASSFGCL